MGRKRKLDDSRRKRERPSAERATFASFVGLPETSHPRHLEQHARDGHGVGRAHRTLPTARFSYSRSCSKCGAQTTSRRLERLQPQRLETFSADLLNGTPRGGLGLVTTFVCLVRVHFLAVLALRGAFRSRQLSLLGKGNRIQGGPQYWQVPLKYGAQFRHSADFHELLVAATSSHGGRTQTGVSDELAIPTPADQS